MNGIHQDFFVPSRQVGPAITATGENDVARKNKPFGRIKGETSRRMSRNIEDFQMDVSNIDFVVFFQKISGYRNLARNFKPKQEGLFFCMFQQRQILLPAFRLDFQSGMNETVPDAVVQMQVRV